MEYFLLKPNGEQTGTFSLEQVRTMLETGVIGPETRFWHEGITEWKSVDQVEEYAHLQPVQSVPKKKPPLPHTWSGSLARAIPSPYQKPPPSSQPAAAPTAKVKKTKAERKKAAPVVPVEPEPEPEPVRVARAAVMAEGFPDPETVQTELVYIPPAGPSRGPGRFTVILSILLAIGAVTLAVWVIHKVTDPFSHVTFVGPNIYVLLDQATIKPYEGDMGNSSVADTLKNRIAESNDPEAAQSLKIALEKEGARHPEEVAQNYILQGKAQYIDAGTYKVIGYFDDDGQLVVPHEGEAWVAISYKGTAVFAHKDAPP